MVIFFGTQDEASPRPASVTHKTHLGICCPWVNSESSNHFMRLHYVTIFGVPDVASVVLHHNKSGGAASNVHACCRCKFAFPDSIDFVETNCARARFGVC